MTRSLLISALAVSLPGLGLAGSLDGARIQPVFPTPSDTIRVEVRGHLPTPCYNAPTASVTTSAKAVTVDVLITPLPTFAPCVLILSPFKVTAEVGKLPAGVYVLNVNLTVASQQIDSLRRPFFVRAHPAWVRQLFLDLLGREPDAAGLAFWTSVLDGGADPKDVALAIFNSKEFKDTGMNVIGAYLAALGRDPDFAGWNYWLTQLKNGTPVSAVVQQFLNSPEFKATYGSQSILAFVQLVYENVLGRAADPSGLNFWTSLLSGGVSRGDLMAGFVTSTEFQNKIRNRGLATLLYMGLLQRSPEAGGSAFWTGKFDQGTAPLDAIEAFLESDEYAARF